MTPDDYARTQKWREETHREAMRAWLDRKPPRVGHWRDWFRVYADTDDGPALFEYLGARSARTGPDLRTAQPCDCRQCRPDQDTETQ